MDIQWISAYFCPTTVLFVDDDLNYLKLLVPQLENEFPLFEFYDDPEIALNYLTDKYKPNKFLESTVDGLERDTINTKGISIDIQKIVQIVYDPNRFSDISLLVTDFNMPAHTGAELCEKLKRKLDLKKLMITSQSEEKLAIELLNKGIISQFIRKAPSKLEERSFIQNLSRAIQELRQDYLYKKSQLILEALLSDDDYMQPPINQPNFIHLFSEIFNSYNLCEYYLIDSSGSFLFLSANGDLSYLLIRTEEDMKVATELLEFSDITAPEIVNQVRAREKMIYWNTEEDFPLTREGLLGKLYHPTKLGNFYYCYVNDRNVLNVDQAKIVSFAKYCKQGLEANN